MTKRVQYTDLGRFALRRVTALGLDRSAFEMKAKEVSVNIPVIRSKRNRRGVWRLVSPDWVTMSSDFLYGYGTDRLDDATTPQEQIEIVRAAAEEYIETLEIFRAFNKPILWKETGRHSSRHVVQHYSTRL